MNTKNQESGTTGPGRRLLDEYPLLVIPTSIAQITSLNEAIVLRQLHYWLTHNEGNPRYLKNGRVWCWNTYQEWREEDFPFWSESTIKRAFSALIKRGLVIKGRFNRLGFDRTGWYTIDYDALERFVEEKIQSGQIDLTSRPNWPGGAGQNDGTIPETTTETTTDHSDDAQAVVGEVKVDSDSSAPGPNFDNREITEKESIRIVCSQCGTESSRKPRDKMTQCRCCRIVMVWDNAMTVNVEGLLVPLGTESQPSQAESFIDQAVEYLESRANARVRRAEIPAIQEYLDRHGLAAFEKVVDRIIDENKGKGRYGRGVICHIINKLPFVGGPGRPEPDSTEIVPEPRRLDH